MMTTRSHGLSKDALRDITDAITALADAKRSLGSEAVVRAKEHLSAVVRSASDGGASWEVIGEALGTTRGNAYQRYRRRPHDAEGWTR